MGRLHAVLSSDYVRLRTDARRRVHHTERLAVGLPVGRHASPPFHEETSMNAALRNALVVAGLAVTTQAAAQIVFYENDDFRGRSFTTDKPVGNFERYGFNDRASSVVVMNEPWEVCVDARFN